MALRTGHGNGAGVPRIEVLPVDELPAGVPGNAGPLNRSGRTEAGTFCRGQSVGFPGRQGPSWQDAPC
jgi:hypothetical protein